MEKSLSHTPIKRLSQGHLNLLETCPPQFQRIYLEQLAAPASPEQQEKMAWGSQFHHLMQQQELGLPLDSLFCMDEEFWPAITALRQKAPEIWQSSGDIIFREAEHCRTLDFDGYLLTAVYDLLILKPEQATIIDWKTYLQPENPLKLQKNWQTRLYLYVLAETELSKYSPAQISLTYWFVKLPHEPQFITFKYSRNIHEETKKSLREIIDKLNTWLEDYYKYNQDFPHIDDCRNRCQYYNYFTSWENQLINKESQEWLTNIDVIEELPF